MSGSQNVPCRLAVNRTVAQVLRDTARVLTDQSANPFRINAYRRAAETLESLDEDVREMIGREGRDGLIRLPSIGRGLAVTIEEIARTGRSAQLDRLQGAQEPELLLQSVPGIGPKLAETIHESLHVDTLEALEIAAHDGRLEDLPGLGPRRTAAIRASVASLLGRGGAGLLEQTDQPSVAMLLDVDGEYRTRAAAGRLPKIAPRRFNPKGEAWLPILHTDHDGWHFTALYSNTGRAHQLNRTRDWVIVYFYDGDHQEGQHTVVTETHGALAGRRVVRGREGETRRHYGG
jgi:hypothetical protein